MKELEKQLSQKVNDRDKISDIDAKIFQIMEMKKNVILEKQNKKRSRLRTDRNKSELSVNNQTTERSKTTKTNPARGGRNKRKKPKRKNRTPTPITQNKQPKVVLTLRLLWKIMRTISVRRIIVEEI